MVSLAGELNPALCRYWAHEAKSSKPFCFLCRRPPSHQFSPYSPPPLDGPQYIFDFGKSHAASACMQSAQLFSKACLVKIRLLRQEIGHNTHCSSIVHKCVLT